MSFWNEHPRPVFWMLLAMSGLCLTMAPVASADDTQDGLHLVSPYDFKAHQHKVQLHSHTTNSDGDHPGNWVMQAYERLGYAAVAITDHDYSRYSSSLADPGGHNIIHIPGVEYSGDKRERSWNHMLGIHIETIHHADGTGARQAQIDQTKQEGGLAFLCHPYDETVHRRGWNGEDILALVEGYHGIEIHNGGSYHAPDGRDYPFKVDLALSSGKRINVISVDDFHRNPEEAMGRGAVIINSDRDAESLRLEDVVSALLSGNYFSAGRLSTTAPEPPRFTDISVNGNTISVTTDKMTDIEFITQRYNYYKDGPNYAQKNEGVQSAQFTATPEDVFIRIKATYTEEGKQSYAWSNPIYCE
jgi:hypothetical protein